MAEQKLWNRNFILLWLGNAQSYIGNSLYIVSLSYLVLELTGTPKYTAMAMASAAIPYIFSPVAGAIVDKINMKKCLIIGDLIRGSGMVVIGLLAWYDQLSISTIIMISFLIGVVGVIYRPSFGVLLPRLVPSADVGRANALNSMAAEISILLGFAFGGVLVAWLGSIWAIFLNGLSFYIMSVCIAAMDFPKIKVESQKWGGIWSEIKDGLQYLTSTKLLFMVPVILLVIKISYSPLEVLMPLKMKEIGGGSKEYGLYFAFLSVGSLTTSMFLSKFGKNMNINRYTTIGLLVMMLAISGTAMEHSLNITYFYAVIFGIGSSLTVISNITFVQTKIEDAYRGRVFGVFGTIEQAGMPATLALIGYLVDYVKMEYILYSISVILLLTALVWFIINQNSSKESNASVKSSS